MSHRIRISLCANCRPALVTGPSGMQLNMAICSDRNVLLYKLLSFITVACLPLQIFKCDRAFAELDGKAADEALGKEGRQVEP